MSWVTLIRRLLELAQNQICTKFPGDRARDADRGAAVGPLRPRAAGTGDRGADLAEAHKRRRIGAGSAPDRCRLMPDRCRRQPGRAIPARDADGGRDAVGPEYLSRVARPPLDGLIDDLYYLEGASPYARLTLPPMPAALLVVNLGAPFRIRAGTDIETAEYADGCVVTTPSPARSSSASRSGPGPSACTSNRGGCRRSCRCPRSNGATGR